VPGTLGQGNKGTREKTPDFPKGLTGGTHNPGYQVGKRSLLSGNSEILPRTGKEKTGIRHTKKTSVLNARGQIGA